MVNHILSRHVTMTVIVFTLFFSGCTKEGNKTGNRLPTEVEINVGGIADQPLQNFVSTRVQQSSIVPMKSGSTTSAIQEEDFDEFSWSLSPDVASTQLHASSLKLKGAAATKTKMGIGKKFRILFYEVANANEIFRESVEITVASQRYLHTLAAGVTYKWYAYSYDDTQSIPLPSNLNSPDIESRTDAPLLYDQGTITVGAVADPRIDIEFDHQIAKVEVKVDGLQVFANSFVTLAARFNNLPLVTKNFSLKQGTLASTALTTTNFNGVLNFVDDGSTAVKKSTNVVYTAVLTSMPILFTGITIKKSGTDVVLVDPGTPRNAIVSGFSTDPKFIKRAAVDLKYKGGVIGTNEWSQGILYYDASDPANPYKISEPFNDETEHPCNYYWNWNTLTPRSVTGQSVFNTGDPCSKVYPLGSWRTPNNADYMSLGSAHLNSPKNGAIYYEAANGEVVRFHQGGWISGSGCNVSNLSDGMYWSILAESANRGYTLEIDGDAQGVNGVTDYAKNIGMCIKCIRSVTP
ncbi:hypothetical protein [Sphingobacterium sp. SYP-B4668]|uniref:hypothetical protein n=1 Tax=Sphingobacterium sp. SYP-B4668 TaxID=2996035 RepID=UPI0022DCF40D|nr:hypothetical protein [Sphingobacterium sp. SYP-B4668]